MPGEEGSAREFAGARILITGAARGIGAAAARRFRASGGVPILVDVEVQAVGRLAAELETTSYVLDVSDPAALTGLAREIGSPDVVVNNAGVLLDRPLLACSDADIRRLMEVDLFGPIAVMRAFGPSMVARRSGVFVNVSSQLAFCGAPGRAVYGACKAALSHLSRSMAAEWGRHGVRVVAVAPGRTETQMTERVRANLRPGEIEATVPLGRFARPEEIAEVICFAASSRASYVSGTTLIADGGYLAL